MARKRTAAKKRKKTASKKTTARTRGRAAGSDIINAWENDPGNGASASGGPLIQRPTPVLDAQPLPTKITHPASGPPPSTFPPGTANFRYWTASEALRRGSDFWGSIAPGLSWQVGAVLPVDLDRGVDLNAFYDRVGLRFFHASAGGRTVYSGESPDVVCHEQGHAILDGIKPQLWNAASTEVAAFHESFGDISALLCALRLQSLRIAVLTETANAVYRTSRLSRLAEQLGWAIRQSNPAAAEPDCLRNAVNSFFYRDPTSLPPQAPASSLSSEPHSFSRLFTAAMFEGLANMFQTRPALDELNLLHASEDAARILIAAVRTTNVVPDFFSQVAAHVLDIARSQFGDTKYEQALSSAFVRHGILPPAMAIDIAAMARSLSPAAPEEQAADLPLQQISVAEYGLGVATIAVHAAAQPKQFNVGGAALALGTAPAPAADVAARAFFENLQRRGRLKFEDALSPGGQFVRATSPRTHESYTHELIRQGDELVLRRVRVDCCFC
jgi:hypothetical protein